MTYSERVLTTRNVVLAVVVILAAWTIWVLVASSFPS
jgi:hypothetical protein